MAKNSSLQKLLELLTPIKALSQEYAATLSGAYPGLARWPKTVKRRLAVARRRGRSRIVILNLVQAGLVHPTLPFYLAIVAVLFGAPTLWSGFSVDDDLLHRELLLTSNLPQAMRSMFTFLNPSTNAGWIDRGVLPWWTAAEAKVVFFRPLATLSHWLDYQLWPNSAALMHMHSLLWYSLLCMTAALLYRRIMGGGLAAALAGVLFTINITHFFSLTAINARNVLQAALFGLIMLSLHDRWRRQGWRPGAWLAPFTLVLTLLSAEGGVAIVAYLAAYALCLDPGSWRQRLGSLIPYGAVFFAWRLVYQGLGYGAWGSSFYIDPGKESMRFGAAVLERWVILIFGQWAMPDPGLYALLSFWARRGYWLVAVLFVILLLIGQLPMFRKIPSARFWALGMALAAIPACAVNPATGRHLMFVGIGAMGLLAQLCAGLVEKQSWLPARNVWRIPAMFSGFHLFLLQAIIFPVLVITTPAVLGGSYYTALMDLGALPGIAQQDVMVVNSPSPGQSMYILSLRESRGQSLPAHLRVLAPAYSPVQVSRTDSNTLVVRPEYGYLLPPGTPLGGTRDLFPLWHPSFVSRYGDGFFRSSTLPLALGQEIVLPGLHIQITALTEDGRPLETRFQFDQPLEASGLRWLLWSWAKGTYLPFNVPAVGQTVQIPGPF